MCTYVYVYVSLLFLILILTPTYTTALFHGCFLGYIWRYGKWEWVFHCLRPQSHSQDQSLMTTLYQTICRFLLGRLFYLGFSGSVVNGPAAGAIQFSFQFPFF
jgi:hypothetical protein